MSRMGHARILFLIFMGACYGGREKLKVKCRMIVTQGRNAERAQMRAPRARPEMLAADQDVAVKT